MVAESFRAAGDRLVNLRDLGNLALDSGGRTRAGVLLRSGAPLPGDRRPQSIAWPPRAVLDLRSPGEVGGRDHPLAGPGTVVRACPFLAEPVSARQVTGWADLGGAYVEFLRAGAGRLAAITEFLARCEGPVLIHCTAGKDRTGVVIAVLLRAAGVSRAAIVGDYRATEAALPEIMSRIPRELTAGIDPTVAQRMMGVPVGAITAVLDEIDSAPGGARGWLRAAGAGAYAVDAWRHRFTTALRVSD